MLLGFLACLLWSTGFVGVKFRLKYIDSPLLFAGERFFLAGLFIAPFCWGKDFKIIMYMTIFNTILGYFAYAKATAQTGYIHTKNKRAGTTFKQSIIPVLIPVHAREDMVRIKKEYSIA